MLASALADHRFDLGSLFKMIQLVGFDPPARRFHQLYWVRVLIGKERVKRNANVHAFGRNFLFAHSEHFVAEYVTEHGQVPRKVAASA